jgi:hypothetical protein
LFHGGSEGFVKCVLGEIEITQEPDQGCEYPARFRAVNGVDRFARPLVCVLLFPQSSIP